MTKPRESFRFPPNGIITLTTDFGLADTFVGVMKGVILSLFPRARMVDLTHEIPPQDVEAGAWTLKDAVRFFPRGTVHLAVVDPGVGSSRRGVALYREGHYFVGPDNGLFSPFLPLEAAVVLDRPEIFKRPVSRTFHGRDIFAPAAARLAAGLPLEKLGSPATGLVELPLPEARQERGAVTGEVILIDRFGNLITNIPEEILTAKQLAEIEVCGRKIQGLSESYSQVRPGELTALVGSCGRLEIAVREGSAKQTLSATKGTRVVVRFREME